MSEITQINERLPEVEVDGAKADLIDYELIGEVLGFIGRSVRRHRIQILVCFAVLGVVALGISKILPRTYHVETRILTDRNLIIASLVNPARSVPRDADQPTRAASEAVMRKDNLVALVKRTSLVERSDALRSSFQRSKDALMKKLGRKPPDDDAKLDAMVGTLEQKLSVSVEGSGIVTIAVDWTDPQLAFDLVEAAQQSFIEARRREEVSSVQDALNILESHEKQASEAVSQAIGELDKVTTKLMADRKKGQQSAQPRPMPLIPQQDHRVAQLKFMLEAKQRSIRDMEDFRLKRLTEMQTQLTEQRSIYSPEHPIILELKERIEALKQDSPQLLALKREEQELEDEYNRAKGKGPDPDKIAAVTGSASSASDELERAAYSATQDPATAVASDNLRMVMAYHAELQRRLEAARMELDIAQASFKHRYTVIDPAEFPDKPIKPKPTMIIVGGFVGGLFLGFFLSLARDILGGRVLESWQVKRALRLPVLAELQVEEST